MVVVALIPMVLVDLEVAEDLLVDLVEVLQVLLAEAVEVVVAVVATRRHRTTQRTIQRTTLRRQAALTLYQESRVGCRYPIA